MEEPNKKKDNRLLFFTILMAGALASVIATYIITRQFTGNLNHLHIAVLSTIIFMIFSYALAVKGGIPPSPPKKTDN
jgi:predicted neutral ceramidase superfamily lipid hydrolase